jgi:hypothetical protein
MRFRPAAVLALLAGGGVLWLTVTRIEKPLSQSATGDGFTPAQTLRVRAATPAVAPEGNPEVPEETAATTGDAALPGPVAPTPKPVVLAASEELPAGPESEPAEGTSPALPPATALENMRTVFRQYALRFGGNPVGSNPEITASLSGQNPRQVIFLNSDDGARVNGRGELVDNWETPYFFHQLSRTEMEIRSAGPDRRMWTSDDLVLK